MVHDFERLMGKQIEWTHRYHGYARLGRTPERLALLGPAVREYRRTHQVPEWCGVDLLRGWAFYLTRADRHSGGYGLMEGGTDIDEWRAVLDRIASHDDATEADRPPME
ncbi:hypothetical protein BCR15_12930 [Tessaracoccus lapidicaptus]|uniref:Uncharacterized protein n=2 Tax=Tessaracoccus lapidicaptus TaxID=1427523 RepID=A0A1C0AR43_9ACTN|nr:hypothetical protein BCR15_12930 [Tessaracoccus lapidicaptus]